MLSEEDWDRELEDRKEAFILTMIKQAGDNGLPEEDLEKIEAWVREATTTFAIMSNVVRGHFHAWWSHGENDLLFSLTEEGRKYVDGMGSKPTPLLRLVPLPPESE